MSAYGADPTARPGGVVVVGSMNVDYLIGCPRRPRWGETILAGSFARGPGGKGGNQAAAAARAGAPTQMVGCVGRDEDGRSLVQALRDSGVDVRFVQHGNGPTGVAFILISPDGDNLITVVTGANAELEPSHVSLAMYTASHSVVLAQLETPLELIAQARRLTAANGSSLILNASPVTDALSGQLHQLADVLVVNRCEAAQILHEPDDADASTLAERLHEASGSVAIITDGANGACWHAGSDAGRHPAPVVDVVDTTGAGDAFAGTLAAAMSQGLALDAAVRAAVEAGTQAAMWWGARPPA